MDGVILPQPAMQLLEKFAALRLGNLRFRRALGQRTEGIEGIEIQIANLAEVRDWLRRFRQSPYSIEVKPRRFNSTRKSAQEMKNGSLAGICSAYSSACGRVFRVAQNENSFPWEIVKKVDS